MKLKNCDLQCVHDAKALLDKNPRKYITIPHLSREIGLNETKLKFAFKQQFGVSIYQYLLQNRMEKAKSLLEGTEKSIKQIAYELGYHTPWAFIDAFRKMFEQTPAQYRRAVAMMLCVIDYFIAESVFK